MNQLNIQTLETSTLRLFEGNARRGNIDKIADSLRVNGQFKPIVVNVGTHTGKPNEVLAGNHTLLAAKHLGWSHIDAVVIDVDRDAAVRIVLADNQTSDSAHNENDALLELLDELDHDYSGTGFTEEEIGKLLGDIDDNEDGGDAEITDAEMNWSVVVNCANEFEQTETLSRLLELGFDVKAVM